MIITLSLFSLWKVVGQRRITGSKAGFHRKSFADPPKLTLHTSRQRSDQTLEGPRDLDDTSGVRLIYRAGLRDRTGAQHGASY